VKVTWGPVAWNDYCRWFEEDPKTGLAINNLIRDVRRNPFQGLGKPEPLKHDLKGWWSRRITAEHRLVYRVAGKGADQSVEIASCRHHY
jgi:toxin YoeB